MTTHPGGHAAGATTRAGDEITHVRFLHALLDIATGHSADFRQVFPFVKVAHRLRGRHRFDAPKILAAMALLLSFMNVHALLGTLFRRRFIHLRERVHDIFFGVFLVARHRQDVMAALFAYLFRDLGLATHRINRYDGALQFQLFEQERNGRDFVGFLRGRDLAQHQVGFRRPRTDHVQRLLAFGRRAAAPRRLAVDGHDLAVEIKIQRFDPTGEARDELDMGDFAKHIAKSIMRRNAVGQDDELFEPIEFLVAKRLHPGERVGAGDGGADGDEDDVAEGMELGSFDAWVFERGKVVKEGTGESLGHTSSPP